MRQILILSGIFLTLFIMYQVFVVNKNYAKLQKQIDDYKDATKGGEETTAAEVIKFIADSGTNDEPTLDEQLTDITDGAGSTNTNID